MLHLDLRGCAVQGLREKKLIEGNLEKVDALRPIAEELGCSLAQLALAWCASCTLLRVHPARPSPCQCVRNPAASGHGCLHTPSLRTERQGWRIKSGDLVSVWHRCVRNEHVSTVITGATKREQIEDNLGALAVVEKLTPEVLEKIEKAVSSKPEPLPSYRS